MVLRKAPDDGELRVLLGRRQPRSRFMPSVFVFPGGQRDREDALATGFPEPIAPPPAGRLDAATRKRLTVFARTALRETLEETGYLVASGEFAAKPRSSLPQSLPQGAWRHYAERGLAPDFAGLRLIARAITPAESPIRFHTRFFLSLGSSLTRLETMDGELEEVGWYRVSEAVNEMPLAGISRQILIEAQLARRTPGYRPVLFRSIGASRMIRCTAAPPPS